MNAIQKKRPVFLTVLAVFSLIGGVLAALLIPVFFLARESLEAALLLVGLPFWLLVVSLLILVALGLGAGIGVLRGRAWGWWIMAFGFMYNIFRNASALLSTSAIIDTVGESSRPFSYYVVKFVTRSLVAVVLLYYLFRPEVRAYFGLERVRAWKAVLILAGVCIVIAIIGTVLALV